MFQDLELFNMNPHVTVDPFKKGIQLAPRQTHHNRWIPGHAGAMYRAM